VFPFAKPVSILAEGFLGCTHTENLAMLKRLLLVLWVVGSWPMTTGMALAGEPSAEIAAAQQIIADQLAAFARDDGPAAYAFAAPEVKAKFPDPDIFMAMVRKGYTPVYRQQSYAFSASELQASGIIRQEVDIIAADGAAWTAEYLLRREPDGSLKIIACSLLKKPGVGA
jgi:hypothetical protein